MAITSPAEALRYFAERAGAGEGNGHGAIRRIDFPELSRLNLTQLRARDHRDLLLRASIQDQLR